MQNNLNSEQKQAAEAPPGPLLIVAGAGTGKTRTLTSRLTCFMEKGVQAHKICAITFTNKAAKEMAGRVEMTYNQRPMTYDRRNLSEVASHKSVVAGPFIGTFHSLGARILRAEARFLNHKSNFAIFDDHDSFSLIKKIYKKLVPTKKDVEDVKGSELAALSTNLANARESPSFFAHKISEIKNKNGVLAALQKSEKTKDQLTLKIFARYEKELEENNGFDFDDLIEKPVQLFRKHPEILKKYQKKFDAILVDEYQDVSPMQYELIRFLAGGHKNLSVVGDDEQLIYGWRYANLGIFLNFEHDWPGAQIVFLEENYRSTANIIGAAAAVTQNNQYRRPKNLWTKNPAGAQIKIFEAADEDEEAEFIAKNIDITYDQQQIINNRKSLLKVVSHKPSVDGQNTAVIYRTNAQSRAIEQALIRHQIPYKIFGGLKFYDRKEIKDIIAALRYFANKQDSLSRERLEKNFGKNRFFDLAEKFSEIERIKKNSSPRELIEVVLKTTDYLEYLERNFINYSERHENVSELIVFASQFKELQSFLEEIALVQATDIGTSNAKGQESKNFVHLSTIHLAKGLEFDRVFVAGTNEGILPHAMSMDKEEQLEEERRLMYVAMTRAKKELYLSFYDLPSRFLSEIPSELVEFVRSSEDNDFGFYDEEKIVSSPE